MIIFLNGCGSSGKTSIAHSIQHIAEELWVTSGVDMFVGMVAPPKQDEYCRFIPGENDRGPTMRIEIGPRADQLFGNLPDFVKLLAESGNNIIIDEVILDSEVLQKYARILSNHKVCFVGVFCDLSVMNEREILRGDRRIGLSNDQFDRVHAGFRPYDLQVDTTDISPFKAAKQILAYVKATPDPEGFHRLRVGIDEHHPS